MQDMNARSIFEAIKGSTIKHVVTLSSVGAHLNSGAGVVQGLHYMEQLFNTLEGVNVLHLRPSYSYNEIVQIYGKAIGKPDLSYVQFPYEDAKTGMMQMGMGESIAAKMIEFVKSMNEGRIQEDLKRTPENTTPTTVEEFAHVFKIVFENS
jgi:hypothetical protein